jgi:glycosyltransferase involved in cell wall biosynthesis
MGAEHHAGGRLEANDCVFFEDFMSMKVSIIIPTYNRSAMIEKTILSFLNQTLEEDQYEIIVCDNNSSDDTKKVVNNIIEAYPKRVRYLFEARQGVHYARNTSAKNATGDILYFTDDDMLAEKKLLEELLKLFKLDTEIGAATGLVLPLFDELPPLWVKRYLHNSWLSLTDKERQEKIIISKSDFGVYSCHQAIKKDVFFRAGGFNPENTQGVWVGDGETGLNIKIKELGYLFGYTSLSVTRHMIPQSRTNLPYLIKRVGNQGFCDSYTEYRSHRSLNGLFLCMLKRNTYGFFIFYAFILFKIVRRKTSMRFLLAYLFYFKNRLIYDFKLLRNANFRKVVEIDDWLSVDEALQIKL